MELSNYDLNLIIRRLPKVLLDVMKTDGWHNRIFIGGGFIRGVIANEKINDIDIFVMSKDNALILADRLCPKGEKPYKTDNALTIRGKLPIQIITRWTFDEIRHVSDSFDFTVCCAAIAYGIKYSEFDDGKTDYTKPRWYSYCDEDFYQDLAAKRLVYRSPARNEDAGGSMLRVLKYYQRGYRIPLDSLGAVISRLHMGVKEDGVTKLMKNKNISEEKAYARIVTGLLIEVDPSIDVNHESHLPSVHGEDLSEEHAQS